MPPVSATATVRELSFSADGLELAGWLHRPAVDRFPVVVGCHGLHSNAGSPKQQALAEACSRKRIAYLRFDHRGCGRSQGVFTAVTSLAGRVADLTAAVAAVRREPGVDGRIALFGSSLGAAVCMAGAPNLFSAAMVLFAAPLRSRDILPLAGHSPVFATGAGLDFDLTPLLPQLHHAMVIHGTADAVVPVDNALRIFAGLGAPKRLRLQPGGDHPMSDPVYQVRFVAEATAWFEEAFGSDESDG